MIATDSKKLKASCLILAGGQGKRLAPDKPLLEINKRSIIERMTDVVIPLFEEVLIVTNTPEKYEFLLLPIVADEVPGCGPLMGIYSGLQRIKHDVAFVCAADMPFLNKEIIRSQFFELGPFEIVVPYPNKRPEFLHAFYRKECLPVIREKLNADSYKIEMLTQTCKTLRLSSKWFAGHGLLEQVDLAFTNINTIQDYRYWKDKFKEVKGREDPMALQLQGGAFGTDALKTIEPEVLQEVRQTLIEQETAYQYNFPEENFSSLWAHSSRVGRIARRIAKAEGLDEEPALLAGLLHDIGKFAHGGYHENDIPEERNAVRLTQRILSGTVYERWIPIINEAILSSYLEGEVTNDIGRVVFDADSLDKLGNMGVAQFFAKKALRRQFLNDDVMIRASVELTYAYHAPDTLKTETGRGFAIKRKTRSFRFYSDLIEEWEELGLGRFKIIEEDIAGIICVFVVPHACSCGGQMEMESDIRDTVKCRSAVMSYRCVKCGARNEFSFCLPDVKGLPNKRIGVRS